MTGLRKRPASAVVLLAVPLLLTGCWDETEPQPKATATTADCLDEGMIAGQLMDWDSRMYRVEGARPATTPVVLPDTFEPVRVVVCRDARVVGADGTVPDELDWEGATLEIDQVELTGDLTDLVAALRTPSRYDPDVMCDSEDRMWEPSRRFFLVDADGRAVVAEQPSDECGWTIREVGDALDALTDAGRETRSGTVLLR